MLRSGRHGWYLNDGAESPKRRLSPLPDHVSPMVFDGPMNYSSGAGPSKPGIDDAPLFKRHPGFPSKLTLYLVDIR